MPNCACLVGQEGKQAGQWRVQPDSWLPLGILMYSNATFGSLLSREQGKQGHIKKSGDECKVFIYIFLQHNCNCIFIEHCSTKKKWNTDAFDDAVWSDMRLWRQVDSLLITRAFIYQSDLVHHVEYRHFKASANLKKRNRPINTVQHHICNTSIRNCKKIMLYLNRPLDIYALLLSNAAFLFSLHNTIDKHEYILIYLLYIYLYIL